MFTSEITTTTFPERIDSISIEKNSKGYTWSIKLYYNNEANGYRSTLDRLSDINNELKKRFEVA